MNHPLPIYRRPESPPSLRDMIAMTKGDPGVAMPASLYREWSHKLPTRWGPLIISQPEAIEQVLFDQKRFDRSRQVSRLIRRAWRDGLAGAEDDSWKRQRRAVGPAFRRASVTEHTEDMRASARNAVERWHGKNEIDVQEEAGRIVSEIVLNTLITGMQNADYARMSADTQAFMRVVTEFGLIDGAPLPDGIVNFFRGTHRSAEAKRLSKFASELAERRSQNSDELNDVITLLKDKGPLQDNILGMITASFETTARGVAWTLYALACQPELQDEVRAEGRVATGLAGQAYADALSLTRRVTKESLRMYPPAPNTVRAAREPVELLGHKIPKNSQIMIDIHAVHHHELVWDDPFTFNPDRFADSAPPRHRAAYIPFSAGPRMCVAAHFAELEIMVIVAELLQSLRFAPAKPDPKVSFHISTHSENGLHVSLAPV